MQSKLTMKGFVIDLLKENVPPSYTYHDYHHTLYVMDKALEIAKHDNCTEEEMRLLDVAALWHDTGYINVYAGHEEEGCVLATKYLPQFGFNGNEIKIICGLIMATRVPQAPQTKLEEILADADLEYLGTKEVKEKSELLFRELKTIHPDLTREEWDRTQISFLKTHRFFTDYCKKHNEPVKHAYLESLLHALE